MRGDDVGGVAEFLTVHDAVLIGVLHRRVGVRRVLFGAVGHAVVVGVGVGRIGPGVGLVAVVHAVVIGVAAGVRHGVRVLVVDGRVGVGRVRLGAVFEAVVVGVGVDGIRPAGRDLHAVVEAVV